MKRSLYGCLIYTTKIQCSCPEQVAIFRTPNGCGWGVKTMELIEKNQLVTEYVGEAITQEEAEERGKIYDSCGQTYLFDLDFNEGECLYTLDAKKYGNISHFINHSVRVFSFKFSNKLFHRQRGQCCCVTFRG